LLGVVFVRGVMSGLTVSEDQMCVLRALLSEEQLAKIQIGNPDKPPEEIVVKSEPRPEEAVVRNEPVDTLRRRDPPAPKLVPLRQRPEGLVSEHAQHVPESTAKASLLRYYSQVYGAPDDQDFVFAVNNATLMSQNVLPKNSKSLIDCPLSLSIRGLSEQVTKTQLEEALEQLNCPKHKELKVFLAKPQLKRRNHGTSTTKTRIASVTFAHEVIREAAEAHLAANPLPESLARPGFNIIVDMKRQYSGKRVRSMLSTSGEEDVKEQRSAKRLALGDKTS